MSPTMHTVAVIGAGAMGRGIAYVSAIAGYNVQLIDTSENILHDAIQSIGKLFDAGIKRGKITDEIRSSAEARISPQQDLAAGVERADLVIEAVPERLDLKQQVLSIVDRKAPAGTILATNTSSLSISTIAGAVRDPQRVIGMHFFNPVHAMQLVELVRGTQTSEETISECQAYVQTIGKTAIVVKDSPGFASSRLGIVLGLEAMRMLEQEVASAEDIDRAMELGYNHPIGPLKLTDLVGLDVRLAVADHLLATIGGDMYRAPEILRKKVAEGKLGKKSGEGFYRW